MKTETRKLIVPLILLLVCAVPTTRAKAEDPPGTHNMLVIGEGPVFLSHLPMFDALNETKTDYTSLHRYQVILEVTFTKDGRDVTDIYTKDRQHNPKVK